MATNICKEKKLMLLELLLLGFVVGANALSCLDDQGKKVDWFIIYKLPKLETYKKLDAVSKGLAYLYMNDAKGNMDKWTISPYNITDKSSSPGRTLSALSSKSKNDISVLMYNDQPPDTSSTASGHSKGVVAFDKMSGIWLIHSVPKFPLGDNYEYPSNALENGQTMLCISLPLDSMNDVGEQLLYIRPKIYYMRRSDAVNKLKIEVQTLFEKKPKFIRKQPWTRTTDIKTLNNTPFKIFAKSNRWNNEIYSQLIAPGLKSSLLVETWRRGSGTIVPPTCQTEYTVQDVESLNMTADGHNFFFFYREDHSKWAISADSGNWICIADINRMESQAKRGGGAACFQSTAVQKAFALSIKHVNGCKKRKG